MVNNNNSTKVSTILGYFNLDFKENGAIKVKSLNKKRKK